jgi:hypothetical protein
LVPICNNGKNIVKHVLGLGCKNKERKRLVSEEFSKKKCKKGGTESNSA